MRWLLACVLVVSGAAFLAMRQGQGSGGEGGGFIDPSLFFGGGETSGPSADSADEPEQLNTWPETIMTTLTPSPRANVPADVADRNVAAFLTMIAVAEGTESAGGYGCLYGSRPSAPRTFNDFTDHPRIASRISNADQRWTSAAGRYQLMAVSPLPGGGSTRSNTWDVLRARLGLPDFGPASQDLACMELIREKGALDDVRAGRVAVAISKVRKVWASFPAAGYGQGERQLSYLLSAYDYAGGVREA